MRPQAISVLVLAVALFYGVQAGTFGNCEKTGPNSNRLIDYVCDWQEYLWSLAPVCIPGVVPLILLLAWFVVWLTCMLCGCCFKCCARNEDRCMFKCLDKCCRGFTHAKLMSILKIGAVVVLCMCIAALIMSWYGFAQSYHGFYDAPGGGRKKNLRYHRFFVPLPPRGGTARKKIFHPYV